MTLKARVKGGRLVVDEPADLPEGTVVELLPLDPGDWLDEDDRAAPLGAECQRPQRYGYVAPYANAVAWYVATSAPHLKNEVRRVYR